VARAADFDLAKELGKPSFTPSVRDAPALAELVAAGDERAPGVLAKLGDAAREAIAARLATGDDAARARLVGVLGRIGGGAAGGATTDAIAALGDASPRVRRAAALALGKLGGDDARAALVARWDSGAEPLDVQRALAEALGKVGGEVALARLRAANVGGDAELARRRDRAVLMAERGELRGAESHVATDVAPPRPVTVRLRTKPGLGELLVEELRARGLPARACGDAAAELELARPWSALFASRLWASAGIRVPLAGDDAAAIARALTSPDVRALLAAWTRGPIRWRLGFASGHRRAVVWRAAREVAAVAPELVNDPAQTTWDVHVADGGLELVPRRADDPRFAWRVAEVPAASQPNVAAALAFAAGARDADRVWDPFVGAGAELVERARLGAYRSLAGSDLAEAALVAARANFAAAGIAVELALADARTHAVGPVELIITNPPLGSRVAVDAARLLAEALPNLARQLAPGGRLVWITPAPAKTSPIAERLGLRCTRALPIDLGGVRGRLERWDRI
jgi:hypothetical protein